MKMLRLLTSVFIMLYLNPVLAQNKTCIGLEGAITRDFFMLSENGKDAEAVSFIEKSAGFNVRRDLRPYLFVETGLIFKKYAEGFTFKNISGFGSPVAMKTRIIPLRLGMKINLCARKIYLVPVLGYAMGLSANSGTNMSDAGEFTFGPDTISYSYALKSDFAKRFSLLQTGAGLELKILKTILLLVSANYLAGFQKTMQIDVEYTTNNSKPTTGRLSNKGAFFSLSAGISYPISDLWAKK